MISASVELCETEVSCTSDFLVRTCDFPKCIEFLQMLAWNLQSLLQNQSLETIPICNVVLWLHNNIAGVHMCDECMPSNVRSVNDKLLSVPWQHVQVCSLTIKYQAYNTSQEKDISDNVCLFWEWLLLQSKDISEQCLPVLRMTPPAIKPWFTIHLNCFTFPTCLKKNSVKPSGNNTLSCNARLIVLPECPWITRTYRNFENSSGSRNIETFSSVLHLSPEQRTIFQVTNAEHWRIAASFIWPISCIVR